MLTNHLEFAASTIAAIYKDRWEIELFFKALKQNLQGQDVRGHERERPAHPDLDSIDRLVAAALAPSPVAGELELVQLGGIVAV